MTASKLIQHPVLIHTWMLNLFLHWVKNSGPFNQIYSAKIMFELLLILNPIYPPQLSYRVQPPSNSRIYPLGRTPATLGSAGVLGSGCESSVRTKSRQLSHDTRSITPVPLGKGEYRGCDRERSGWNPSAYGTSPW